MSKPVVNSEVNSSSSSEKFTFLDVKKIFHKFEINYAIFFSQLLCFIHVLYFTLTNTKQYFFPNVEFWLQSKKNCGVHFYFPLF